MPWQTFILEPVGSRGRSGLVN